MSFLPSLTPFGTTAAPLDVLDPQARSGAGRQPCAFWAVIAALLLALPARGDTLTGQAVTGTGQPVVGATVEIQDAGLSVTTNGTGSFTVTLPTGIYNLQIIPSTTSGLASQVVAHIVVNGFTNVGQVVLTAGFALSGTVHKPNGLPLVGGDIDVFDVNTGIKLFTPNDITAANGTFTVQVPAGTYRVRNEPVPGQLYVAQSQIVTVTGTTNLGIITLPQGHILTGTLLQASNNQPAVNVDIDVDDAVTGQRIETPGDNTNTQGVFTVIVPTGTFDVSFQHAPGQLLVDQRIFGVTVNSQTNVGIHHMLAGVEISGFLVDPMGIPVVDTDIDARSQAGDVVQFTIDDVTGPTGQFKVVVAPGSYRIVARPDPSLGLVAASSPYITFNTSGTVPTFNLQAGFPLSGTVTAFAGGLPEDDCAVVLTVPGTGQVIETLNNLTDANGAYTVLAPLGTVDVTFKTRKASLAQDQTFSSVAISGPTTLNANLPIVPMFVFLDDPANPDPQIVPPGSPLFVNALIYNPTAFTSGVFLAVEVEDPFGNVTTLVSGAPVVLGPGGYIFGQFFPVTLPPLNPAHAGLPHKFRLTVTDPTTGVEADSDAMVFLPQ